VLVVDDNVVNRRFACVLLERRGHVVAVAENGQEAVDLVVSSSFDLVLMDVQMPILDGLSATKQIRERERGTGGRLPIIAVTAHALVGDRLMCLDAGMDDYVSKPVRPEALFAAIARIVPAPKGDDAFDGPALLALALGEPALARELLDVFLEDVPAQLGALRTGIADGDPRAIGEAAHAIRGAAATITAARVAAEADAIERAAAAGDVNTATQRCDALEHEIAVLREHVSAWYQ
jgi:two-component system sensor histidine kinase/response regulator